MGDVVPFSALKRSRDMNAAGPKAIPSELRIYAHQIQECVANWCGIKFRTSEDLNWRMRVSKAAQIVSSCIQTYISSGGYWSGTWPIFIAENLETSLVEKCARHVYFYLGDILRQEFHPRIMVAYRRANAESGQLSIDWGQRDYDTFGELLDFVASMLVAIRAQKIEARRNRNMSVIG